MNIDQSGFILTDKEAEILNQTDTMQIVCAHILAGGSLVDLAETWQLPFGRIRLWMAADQDRDKAYIQALNMRAELEAEKIKRQLKRIAFPDLKRIYNADGTLKPFLEWPDEIASTVESLQYDENGKLVKVKQPDMLKALELHGKTIAMFSEKLTVDGSMSLEQMLVVVDKEARSMMAKQAPPKAIESGEKDGHTKDQS